MIAHTIGLQPPIRKRMRAPRTLVQHSHGAPLRSRAVSAPAPAVPTRPETRRRVRQDFSTASGSNRSLPIKTELKDAVFSLQLVRESRLLHNKCDTGAKGLKTSIPNVLLGTRPWYPPHAFGARGSAPCALASVRCFPPAAWSPNVKLKRDIPTS